MAFKPGRWHHGRNRLVILELVHVKQAEGGINDVVTFQLLHRLSFGGQYDTIHTSVPPEETMARAASLLGAGGRTGSFASV